MEDIVRKQGINEINFNVSLESLKSQIRLSKDLISMQEHILNREEIIKSKVMNISKEVNEKITNFLKIFNTSIS